MKIELQISSVFHQKVPPSDKNLGGDKWDVLEETNVAGVLEMLNLTHIHTILILNGRQTKKDTILKADDVLKVFSAVSGG